MFKNLVQYDDRYSPFLGPTNLQREIDSLFEDFARPRSRRSESWAPSCDLQETDDHYLLKFDLPGVNRDDIQVEMKDNQLFVSGERKEESNENEGSRHFFERIYGKFSRVFTLPTAIESEKIEASYKDGVLHIALPKAANAKPRRIEITQGAGNLIKKLLGNKPEDKTAKAA